MKNLMASLETQFGWPCLSYFFISLSQFALSGVVVGSLFSIIFSVLALMNLFVAVKCKQKNYFIIQTLSNRAALPWTKRQEQMLFCGFLLLIPSALSTVPEASMTACIISSVCAALAGAFASNDLSESKAKAAVSKDKKNDSNDSDK